MKILVAYAELVVCSMGPSLPQRNFCWVVLKVLSNIFALSSGFQVTNHNHRSNVVDYSIYYTVTQMSIFLWVFTLGGSETQILRTRTYRKHSEIISSHYWPLTELKSNIINYLSGDLKFMTWRVGDWPFPHYKDDAVKTWRTTSFVITWAKRFGFVSLQR